MLAMRRRQRPPRPPTGPRSEERAATPAGRAPRGPSGGGLPLAALASLASALLAAALFAPSLRCGLVFDDHLAVTGNADALGAAPWGELWAHDFWGKPLAAADSNRSYRPLVVASFRTQLQALAAAAGADSGAGRNDVAEGAAWALHAVNVGLHAAVSACVALAAAAAAPAPAPAPAAASGNPAAARSSGLDALRRCSRGGWVAAAAAGALFAAHPAHVEAVAGVVGRAELMAALGGIAALACYARADLGPRGAPNAWLGAFCACVGTATLCKETAVTVTAVAAAPDALTLLAWALGFGRRGGPQQAWASIRPALVRLAAATLMAGGYVALRVLLMGGDATLERSELIRRTENPLATLRGWQRVLSVLIVHSQYLRLLLWPQVLCAEYSYDCVPMAARGALWDWRATPALLAWAVAAWCVARAARDAMRGDGVLLSCWLLALLPFVPASHVLLRVGTLVAERLLYLPTVGAAIGAGAAFDRWICRSHGGRRVAAWLCLAVAVTLGGTRCVVRQADWKDDTALFESAVAACPRSAKMNLMLAQQRLAHGRVDQTEALLDTAAALDPEYCDVAYVRGKVAIARGDAARASAALNASVHCVYTANKGWELLQQLWRVRLAGEEARTPDGRVALHLEIAGVVEGMGQLGPAATHIIEAAKVEMERGHHAEAQTLASRARVLAPGAGEPAFWAGRAAEEAGDEKAAIAYYLAAVESGEANVAAAAASYAPALFDRAIAAAGDDSPTALARSHEDAGVFLNAVVEGVAANASSVGDLEVLLPYERLAAHHLWVCGQELMRPPTEAEGRDAVGAVRCMELAQRVERAANERRGTAVPVALVPCEHHYVLGASLAWLGRHPEAIEQMREATVCPETRETAAIFIDALQAAS